MKFLKSLVLAVGLILPTALPSIPVQAQPVSQYLQIASKYSQIRDASVQIYTDIGNSCSATKVGKDLFLTAGHCFADTNTGVWIGNIKGQVLKVDHENDLALFKAETSHIPFIKLAPRNPDIDDDILIVGYPLAINGQFVTKGSVQSVTGNRMWLDGSVAPGSSGGGVFTMGPFGNYRLVGVLVEVAVDQGDGFFFGREKVNYLSRAVPLETIITFIHG